ncbi:MAG: tetratricopeptide repeat protein [Bdellovibrionota bacterium]
MAIPFKIEVKRLGEELLIVNFIRLLLICLFIGGTNIQCASKQLSHANSKETSKLKATQRYDSQISYRYFTLARLAELNSNPHLALELYSKAAAHHPSSTYLRIKQAEQWISLGQVYQAKRILEETAANENPQYHLLLSKVFATELNLDKSVEHLDKAIKIFNTSGDFIKARESIFMKVAFLSDSQRFDLAVETLKKYLKTFPKDEIAVFFLGRIHAIRGESSEAVKRYQEALELRPHFSAAAKALGLQYELNGQNPLAIEAYQQALLISSEDIPLRNKIANLLLIEENYSAALEHLHFVLESDPKNSALKFRVALIHLKLENLETAEKYLLELSQDKTLEHDRIYFFIANIKEQQNQYSEAISFYEKIPARSQHFLEARLKISTIWEEFLNDHPESIKNLKESIQLNPYSKELYLSLAYRYEKKGNLEAAIEVTNQGKKSLPRDEDLLFFLGNLLDRSGDFESGIGVMRELLKLNPNHAHAMNHIGYVFTERKMNLEEAEELLIMAVQLEPQNAYIIDSLGWLYFQKGKYNKAREFLERAHRLEPNERVIAEHLGDAYSKLELHGLALRMYKRVVELDQEKNQAEDMEAARRRIQDKIAALPELEALH